MDKNKSFRVLSEAEFERLTLAEKAAYLKEAIAAQRLLNEQMADAINALAKAPPQNLK